MMRFGTRPGSRDAFFWSQGADPLIVFAVRMLVLDGLRVPPWEQHPDGRRQLRAAGLTEQGWREWVSTLVAIHAEMGELMQKLPDLDAAAVARGRALSDVFTDPSLALAGDERLQASVREEWQAFRVATGAWERPLDIEPPLRTPDRRTWSDLSASYRQVPHLEVFVVEYPVPTVMILPPTTALIAPEGSPAAYEDQLRAAVRDLTAANGTAASA